MEELTRLKNVLRDIKKYERAALLLEFDRETLCPEDALKDSVESEIWIETQAYRLKKSPEYERDLLKLHEKKETLDEWNRALEEKLYRDYVQEKRISPEKKDEFISIQKKAYLDWSKAYEQNDFSIFSPSLSEYIQSLKEACSLYIKAMEGPKPACHYDLLLDRYERGMTSSELDRIFEPCLPRLRKLSDSIQKSRKKIRYDFLSRPVSDECQMRFAKSLVELLGFDMKRGTLLKAGTAFTSRLSPHDVRMTTYIEPQNFTSSLYSVLHECGHALFEQLQPKENHAYFIADNKTEGMHESVSRFYENIIGRSEGFIHFIYPIMLEYMPDVLSDVTERELYEAVNISRPNLIRTEADEVTYSLHILIRYELEKSLFAGRLQIDDLPDAWNDKYEKYLGIRPGNAREGLLQDIHWTSDFGYFPTYLLGNIYGAMYYECLCRDVNVDRCLREGRFMEITKWMKENVFKKADRLTPKEWIREITGNDICVEPYLSYLENKYALLYDINIR